jgi:hypothetical protein
MPQRSSTSLNPRRASCRPASAVRRAVEKGVLMHIHFREKGNMRSCFFAVRVAPPIRPKPHGDPLPGDNPYRTSRRRRSPRVSESARRRRHRVPFRFARRPRFRVHRFRGDFPEIEPSACPPREHTACPSVSPPPQQ